MIDIFEDYYNKIEKQSLNEEILSAEDNFEHSGKKDFYSLKRKTFSDDIALLDTLPIGRTFVRLRPADRSYIYATKVANNKWRVDNGNYWSDNNIVSVAWEDPSPLVGGIVCVRAADDII